MNNRTANENKYWDADWKAKYYPGEQPKPKVTVNIDGNIITIEYKVVNRKCFDFMATPTRNVTLNGKRIALVELIRKIK